MSNSDGSTWKGRPPKTDRSRSAHFVLSKCQAYFEYLLLENNSQTQFSNLRILDFQSRTKETFTVGFVLALFVLSITIHPDWTNQQHANHCLAGLPVLTQPPFNFQNDKAGKVKFKNHFTRLVSRLQNAKDPDSFLRSPSFAWKTQSARQQPDEPDLDSDELPADTPYQPEGTEGTDWHRVRSFALNTALAAGQRRAEHVLPSLIIQRSKLLPVDVADALGVHVESIVPKGTIIAVYGGEIIFF